MSFFKVRNFFVNNKATKKTFLLLTRIWTIHRRSSYLRSLVKRSQVVIYFSETFPRSRLTLIVGVWFLFERLGLEILTFLKLQFRPIEKNHIDLGFLKGLALGTINPHPSSYIQEPPYYSLLLLSGGGGTRKMSNKNG